MACFCLLRAKPHLSWRLPFWFGRNLVPSRRGAILYHLAPPHILPQKTHTHYSSILPFRCVPVPQTGLLFSGRRVRICPPIYIFAFRRHHLWLSCGHLAAFPELYPCPLAYLELSVFVHRCGGHAACANCDAQKQLRRRLYVLGSFIHGVNWIIADL